MADPRRLADDFVKELRGVAGDHLRAATLFGSGARGEWLEGVSDVNVLVLFDNIDAPLLSRVSPAARAAMPRGVRPLVMELNEWRRAADVFGIELADMKDAHVPLHGDDPAAAFTYDATALRFQAEHELRGKLLHLHAGMMLAEDAKRLGQLLVHALPSFVTYLRVALRLAGQTVPAAMRDVINQGCAVTGASPNAFLGVLEARLNGTGLTVSLTDSLANDFNHNAERLAAYVDAFGRKQ
jgi:hypothetical protein